MGLNISATFNSAVTIYIIIPLLVIPQLVLGGAMFSFDKLNDWFGGGDEKTPVIADFFVSRWAYEGLAVHQFRNNAYDKPLYPFKKKESFINFRTAYLLPKLTDVNSKCIRDKDKLDSKQLNNNIALLKNEIIRESKIVPSDAIPTFHPSFNGNDFQNNKQILNDLTTYYGNQFNLLNEKKTRALQIFEEKLAARNIKIDDFKNQNANEHLADLVTNSLEKEKFRIENNSIVQLIDPVFRDSKNANSLNYRAQMFAPKKSFLGKLHPTFTFNLMVIWIMTLLLFITLYFDFLSFIVNLMGKLTNKKSS